MRIYAAESEKQNLLPKQLGLPFLGREIDIHGHFDAKRTGIQFIGKAVHVFDNTYRCFADVAGSLCIVEVSITWLGEQKKT